MYKNRFYRTGIFNQDLVRFCVRYYESNLLICAKTPLEEKAKNSLRFFHTQIRNFCDRHPLFERSLKPINLKTPMPQIIKTMQRASQISRVGPMATVAGAIAEFVGKSLLRYSDEIIIENGGDIFISTKHIRKIGIFAGVGNIFNRLALIIKPGDTPCGICTSSGRIGHSISFGKTSATIAITKSCTLADGYATYFGNMVKKDSDIQPALKIAKQSNKLKGLIFITPCNMGSYGKITFDVLDK